MRRPPDHSSSFERGELAAPDVLEREMDRDPEGAGAAVLLGDADAHQAELGEIPEELAREAVLAVPLRRVRLDLLRTEVARERLDLALLRSEVEIHPGRDISRGVLRLWLALAVLFPALLAGCGSTPPSPESVVRAWSQELNSGDNEAAAKLFAPGAEVVQAGKAIRLKTHADALAWNTALPCSGRLVSIKTSGDTTRATFVLGERPNKKCDGPGQRATAIFRVRKGKIVLWHQTSPEPAPVGPAV